MDIEDDIKIVKEFNQKNRFRDCGRVNNAIDHILIEIEQDKKRIKELEVKLEFKQKVKEEIDIEEYEFPAYADKLNPVEKKLLDLINENRRCIKQLHNLKSYYIDKYKIKEELERAKKENEPYEEYEIESRMYWINQGKISLAKKLLEEE